MENWALHDDALPCLDELEQRIPGVRFGLITNGDLAYQTRKVTAVGLDARIDGIVASGEVGVVKPDAAIFVARLRGVRRRTRRRRLRRRPSAHRRDRRRPAGLTGVWLNRTAVVPDPPDAADARAAAVVEIRSLTDLPAVLAPIPANENRRPRRESPA